MLLDAIPSNYRVVSEKTRAMSSICFRPSVHPSDRSARINWFSSMATNE